MMQCCCHDNFYNLTYCISDRLYKVSTEYNMSIHSLKILIAGLLNTSSAEGESSITLNLQPCHSFCFQMRTDLTPAEQVFVAEERDEITAMLVGEEQGWLLQNLEKLLDGKGLLLTPTAGSVTSREAGTTFCQAVRWVRACDLKISTRTQWSTPAVGGAQVERLREALTAASRDTCPWSPMARLIIVWSAMPRLVNTLQVVGDRASALTALKVMADLSVWPESVVENLAKDVANGAPTLLVEDLLVTAPSLATKLGLQAPRHTVFFRPGSRATVSIMDMRGNGVLG